MWYKKKKKKYRVEYEDYIFEYNTVEEFATLVMESGAKIQNLYEPNTKEFDEFNEVRWAWKG